MQISTIDLFLTISVALSFYHLDQLSLF